MRAVLQRVSSANLVINEKEYSSINQGLLVLLGICDDDEMEDILWLVKKITQMRLFADEEGKMNLSVEDIGGEILVVSQFTLYASTKKGNRPSYIKAAKPDYANEMYEAFVSKLQNDFKGKVATGVFAADMKITLCNDGPVTIIIDSKNKE